MTVDDSKSYLGYLDKLVDKCSSTYHCSIGKRPIYADYSTFPEEVESLKKLNQKAPKFNAGYRVRIAKYKNIYRKLVKGNIFDCFCVVN